MQPELQSIGAFGATTGGREVGAAPTDQAVTAAAHVGLGKLAALTIQVALAVFLIRQFQIEARGFFVVSLLCGGGFVVHALLPYAYRLPFFVLLSLGAVIWVLGTTVGVWLIGLSLLLIGLCHLPIAFPRRVSLVITAGACLAVVRAGWMPAPWPRAVWPIFGSMLMFRLIIYLYDLRHDTGPRSMWQTLAYFFLLPNVCFALFPLVDYKTFRRTYYDADAPQIYQVGVQRMLRGIGHLLLYRVVYYYWTLAPAEVTSPWSLAQFLVANFALYLRVSGNFHVIAGILHLFGFNLPDTHHFYFLAASIGDLWRRINIYWKDFMQKVFFYPAFFALRRHGTTPALLLSTLCVVVMTWLLHSYQWFWIGGTFPLTWQDATFWTVIGLFMLLQNAYLEHPQRRRAAAAPTALVRASVQGLRVAATFTLMCVLWSLWTCESLSDWISVWAVLGLPPGVAAAAGSAVVVGFYLSVVVLPAVPLAAERVAGPLRAGAPQPFWPAAALTSVALGALCLVSLPRTFLPLGPRVSAIVHTLRQTKLNRLDAAKMHRGYYEDLFNVARLDSRLWEVEAMRPPDWPNPGDRGVNRPADGLLGYELVPSTAIIFKGAPFHVNRWGMRDQEYTREKAPGTYRIALLGSSQEMGFGIADGETFEALVEDRLNHHSRDRHYELLNFAVAGYSPLQHMVALERKVFDFDPDVVFYFANPGDPRSAVEHLAKVADRPGVTRASPFIANLLRDAAIDRNTPQAIRLQRLNPSQMRLLDWTYRRIVELCREHGVTPVWIFLPMNGELKAERIQNAARDAGFTTLDLSAVYAGYDRAALRLGAWDNHPNAAGHQLIANGLYSILERRPELLGAPKPDEPPVHGGIGQ